MFRGAIPIALNQFAYWTLFCSHYIFLKNKFFLFWIYNDFGYDYCKFVMMSICHLAASGIAYPFYFVREMVDVWPKERGGFCTWNNNYRQCIKWGLTNMDLQFFNLLRGWSMWQQRYGIPYFIAIWFADKFGMMSNCNEAYNSLETQFPIFSENV